MPAPTDRLAYNPDWRPDWRQSDEYEWLAARDNTAQWAWEFLRRNDAYRRLVTEDIAYDPQSAPAHVPQQDRTRQPDEQPDDYIRRMVAASEMPATPHASTDQHGRLLLPGLVDRMLEPFCLLKETFQSPSINDPPRFSVPIGAMLGGSDVPYSVEVGPASLWLELDLRIPFEWQVSLLKNVFDAAQKRGKDDGLFDLLPLRRRAEQYTKYLQLLDAAAMGVSAAEASKAMSTEDVVTYKEADNWLGSAIRLRDGGFRALALMARGEAAGAKRSKRKK